MGEIENCHHNGKLSLEKEIKNLKSFDKDKYSKFIIFRLALNIIVLSLSAAGIYFIMQVNTPDQKHEYKYEEVFATGLSCFTVTIFIEGFSSIYYLYTLYLRRKMKYKLKKL